MIKSVNVYSRAKIKENLPESDHIIISIVNCWDPPIFPEAKNVLTLSFGDITPKVAHNFGVDLWAMRYKDAQKVLEFINFYNRGDVPFDLYVHCSAGISRSGAIGNFANQYLSLDDREFHEKFPQIIPNSWVENLLWSVVGE